MFYRTDDPISDYLNYSEDQERWLETLPKCNCCDEPIQQDSAVCIDGDWYCDECLQAMRESIGDD